MIAVVGHFVATDGDWPDNLGQLDETVTLIRCQWRDLQQKDRGGAA